MDCQKDTTKSQQGFDTCNLTYNLKEELAIVYIYIYENEVVFNKFYIHRALQVDSIIHEMLGF